MVVAFLLEYLNNGMNGIPNQIEDGHNQYRRKQNPHISSPSSPPRNMLRALDTIIGTSSIHLIIPHNQIIHDIKILLLEVF